VLETVPPVADHVTAVFVVPVTVAMNCFVAPYCRLAVVGETLTLTIGGAVTVTVADALLVVSWTLVAVTVNVPGVLPAV
jgi:hypothetical protein